jgi:thioredoxin reductase (NADPH)
VRYSRIIIVGCGPAGMACAIQLKRMGLQPLVIEKDHPGGLLINASLVENYPGFPGGISGPELAMRFEEQFSSFQIEILRDEVLNANYTNGEFRLTGNMDTYNCHILVAATGTIPIIPDNCPMELRIKGLVHFDIAGLRQTRNKTIGIIGAGDAAFDYSLSMAENCNKVYIFNRGDRVRALKVMNEKVFINKNIEYLENIHLKSLELTAEEQIKAIFNRESGNCAYLLDYLIFATGRKPASVFFQESLRGDLTGLIDERRFYLIGDIINGPYRQVSVAVGDGVKIAMEIFRNESNQ